jgi:hypothetical protein
VGGLLLVPLVVMMVGKGGPGSCDVKVLLVDGGVDRQRIDRAAENLLIPGMRVRRRPSTSFYVIQRIPDCGRSSFLVVVMVASNLVVPTAGVRTCVIVQGGYTYRHRRLVVEGEELVGERPRCLPRRHGENN